MTLTLTTNRDNAKKYWTIEDVRNAIKNHAKTHGLKYPVVEDVLHETGKTYWIIGVKWFNNDVEWIA